MRATMGASSEPEGGIGLINCARYSEVGDNIHVITFADRGHYPDWG